MNAIDFLLKEHNHVRKSFIDIIEASHRDKTRHKKFEALCQELIRHETMEHQVWYPHFKNRLSRTVSHLLTEEKHAEKAIQQLDHIKSEEVWNEKLLKFRKNVENHAREEEVKLFPEVLRILSKKELEEIGKKMAVFKKKYLH